MKTPASQTAMRLYVSSLQYDQIADDHAVIAKQ